MIALISFLIQLAIHLGLLWVVNLLTQAVLDATADRRGAAWAFARWFISAMINTMILGIIQTLLFSFLPPAPDGLQAAGDTVRYGVVAYALLYPAWRLVRGGRSA